MQPTSNPNNNIVWKNTEHLGGTPLLIAKNTEHLEGTSHTASKTQKSLKNTWIIFLFTWNPLPCEVLYYHCRMHEATSQEKGVPCPYEPDAGKNFE